MAQSTQLSSASGYDVSRMIFNKPIEGTIPGSKPAVKFYRVPIQTRNEDGTVGDLILRTEKVFSFGVQENHDPTTKKLTGHVMPLCLWDRNEVTNAQQEWTDVFTDIVERTKEHLVSVRNDIKQYDLEIRDLKKFNPLHWKRGDDGKLVEGQGPTLYVKLIESRKQNKILTQFYEFPDEDGNPGQRLDPETLTGKYCDVCAAIKIESVFIGSKISLQVKLYEAEVSIKDGGMRRLLRRPQTSELSKTRNAFSQMSMTNRDNDNGNTSDSGSLNGDSGGEEKDDQPATPPPRPQRQRNRRRRKVAPRA